MNRGRFALIIAVVAFGTGSLGGSVALAASVGDSREGSAVSGATDQSSYSYSQSMMVAPTAR